MENQPIDYAKLIAEARLRPPVSSPRELAAELATLNARERARVQKLVAEGGLEALQREKDRDAASFRQQQEAEGAERTKREQDAMQKRMDDLRAQQSAVFDCSLVTDPETDEPCTAADLALRKYQRSLKAIADRVAQPVEITNEFGLSELQRKAELRSRFEAARAESLRPKDLPREKF